MPDGGVPIPQGNKGPVSTFTGGPVSARPVDPTMLSVNLPRPPPSAATMLSVNVPAPPTVFRTAQAYAETDPNLYPNDRVNLEIAATPALRDRVAVADSYTEKGIREAAGIISARRKADGLVPLAPDTVTALVDEAREYNHSNGGDTFAGRVSPHILTPHGAERAQIAVAPPMFDAVRELRYLAPLTDDFKERAARANTWEQVPRHEVAHASIPDESTADVTGMLARIAAGESGMADKLKDMADSRLLNIDSGHAATADTLMRIRKQLLTDPAKLHAEIDGKDLDQLEKIAESKRAPGSALEEISEYAHVKILAEGIRKGDEQSKRIAEKFFEGGVAEVQAIDNLKPEKLQVTTEAATQLLRIQASLEKNTTVGKDNGLSKAMPAIEAAHPVEFANARRYIKEHEDIKPAASPRKSPAPKP